MPLYKKSQANLDDVLLSTRENLSGARVIRAFCKEDDERKLFETRNETLNKSRKFVGAIAAITNPLTYVLVNLGIIALLYTGAIKVEAGALTQGQVLALYNLMSQILIELIKLANLIVTVTKAAACGSRIEAVLTMQPSLQVVDGEKQGERGENNEINGINENSGAAGAIIEFNNVTARYNDGADAAIENVSFTVFRGERVGVIGGTGSGKTTLVNLIPRFYDVVDGEVKVDGKNVKHGDLTSLREKIGVVPQKALLFKGTVRENLLWGRSDATDEELYEALKIAQAEEFVLEKGGLDSAVEQGGKNFSGGQKQRLTIARALVRKPQILILDDSASALDYATEAELRAKLNGLETTVIIVSQRASSVKNADKIVVLDDGKAVGIGTHEELFNTCEVYREICLSQMQTGGAV
jgi:ABC-type multidrug transport system fused ATPase/permease subunit